MKADQNFFSKIGSKGITWKGMIKGIAKYIMGEECDREDEASKLVSEVLDSIYPDKWNVEKRDSVSKPGASTTWVVVERGEG